VHLVDERHINNLLYKHNLAMSCCPCLVDQVHAIVHPEYVYEPTIPRKASNHGVPKDQQLHRHFHQDFNKDSMAIED
jgi:hypothetical protein